MCERETLSPLDQRVLGILNGEIQILKINRERILQKETPLTSLEAQRGETDLITGRIWGKCI